MSPDDLNTFFEQFTRAVFDPSAPLPTAWPVGALGVLLLFCTQIGAGIPLGVIMARDAGLSPLVTAVLYLISDIFLACTFEPLLLALRWLGKRVDFVARLGNRLSKLSGATGLSQGKVQGPLGLILFSFAWAPAPARAASEAAGHGFISGWTLAIMGDMLYFTLIMVSTLWVSSVLGDDRLAVGAVLVFAWLLPILLRRLRRDSSDAYVTMRRPRDLRVATVSAGVSDADAFEAPAASRMTSRKGSVSHNGRRRRTTRTRYH